MNSQAGVAHFLSQLDPVGMALFGVLVMGSILSWTIISIKSIAAIRATMHQGPIGKPMLLPSNMAPKMPKDFDRLLSAFRFAQEHSEPSSQLSDAWVVASLQVALDQERMNMEKGHTLLATVASSAPFVGLTGTVWGIYHALLAVSVEAQASLDQVAGPVGEALLMTGFGIAVAIPASIAYNVFGRVNKTRMQYLQSFAHQLRHWGSPQPTAQPALAVVGVAS